MAEKQAQEKRKMIAAGSLGTSRAPQQAKESQLGTRQRPGEKGPTRDRSEEGSDTRENMSQIARDFIWAAVIPPENEIILG